MTRKEALKIAQKEAVMCGGVSTINGKKLKGKNGYWYLGFKKVTDIDNEVLKYVPVDENYVNKLIGK